MDADLRAVAEARELLRRARGAADALAREEPAELDGYVRAMGAAASAAARELAEAAVRETGFGVVEHKETKNRLASQTLTTALLGQRILGVLERDPARGVVTYGVPVGVVAAVIPCTNPTSTAIFKALISIKAGCAVVMSPHPRSVECTRRAVEVCREALTAAGGPAGALGCLSLAQMAATRELMRHELTDVILATGGLSLVRAAYSSGKPAYGVGPGNVPVYLDRSADPVDAVDKVFRGTTFDNGTVCASEQALVVDEPLAAALRSAAEAAGGYFLDAAEAVSLANYLFGGGTFNAAAVGRTARQIAAAAGLEVPADTRVLLAEPDGVGVDYPLSGEKLCPVLAWYVVDGWRAGCERCIELLRHGGMGHTLALHAANSAVVEAFAREKPVCRVLVNTCSALGAVGATTNLEPSLTLGPGAWGGSSTGDNVSARHLTDRKRLAWDSSLTPRDADKPGGETISDERIKHAVAKALDELGL